MAKQPCHQPTTRQRRSPVAVFAALCALGLWLDATGAVAAPNSPQTPQRNKESQSAQSGKFVSAQNDKLTMTAQSGKQQSHQITDQTKVFLNGQPAQLSGLQKGDHITVRTGPNNETLEIHATRKSQNKEESMKPGATSQGHQPQEEESTQPVMLGVLVGPSPTQGVQVQEVRPDSDAARAGLRPGDYILDVDGKKVSSPEGLSRQIDRFHPGEHAKLTIWRNDQRQQITVSFTKENQTAQTGPLPRERRSGYRGEESAQEGRSEDQAWLGVFLGRSNQQGALVRQTYAGGPAAQAGLRPGDVLVKINGKNVNSPGQAIDVLDGLQPDQKVKITAERNGQQRTFEVTLANRADFFPRETWRQSGYPPQGRPWEGSDYGPGQMQMQQQRHLCEQHQRLENLIRQLKDEVEQLRREVASQQKQPGNAPPRGQ